MSSEKFKLVFEEIQSRIELPEYLKIISLKLSHDLPDVKTVNEILYEYNVNRSIAKVDFLHLIFEYIKLSLEDNILTNTERDHIKYLKKIFQIQPGDFQFHNLQLEKVIAFQLFKIYEDDFITPEEALLKVDLQELFGLSFDQMNEYSKKEAILSIEKGAAIENLDVFFTHDEYFKLKSNL